MHLLERRQEVLASQVLPDFLDQLENQGHKVSLVLLDTLVHQDRQVFLVPQALVDSQVVQVPLDLLDSPDLLANPALQVSLAHQHRQVSLVPQAPVDSQVVQVPLDHPDSPDLLANPVRQDSLVPQALMGSQAAQAFPPDLQALLDSLENQAPPVFHQDPQDSLENQAPPVSHQDLQDLLDSLVHPVLQALLVSHLKLLTPLDSLENQAVLLAPQAFLAQEHTQEHLVPGALEHLEIVLPLELAVVEAVVAAEDQERDALLPEAVAEVDVLPVEDAQVLKESLKSVLEHLVVPLIPEHLVQVVPRGQTPIISIHS